MIEPPKKNHITCLTLLADLAETSRHVRRTARRSAPIAIMGAHFASSLTKTDGVHRTDVEDAESAACVWVWHFSGFYGL